MAIKRDITDMLTFDGNPILIIKDKELEVNADAPTVLKIMNNLENDSVDMEQIGIVYELVFSEKCRKEIEKLKLSYKDWVAVVKEAMNLAMGESEPQGEQ